MIKKFLRQVTVTGADDATNPYDLFEISQRFPFVEWGILLSKNSAGYPRFPCWDWIEGAITEKHPRVNFSGHLCGSWVRDIVLGKNTFLESARNALGYNILYGFKRYQLNFHAEVQPLLNAGLFIQSLVLLTLVHKQQVIFQMDGVNERLFDLAHSSLAIKSGIDAAPLFDLSGGAGVLPEKWPEPIDDYCGYAGGLSVENLEQQLRGIAKAVTCKDGSLRPVWIDAETRLRTGRALDLAKVTRFLEIAEPYVL